jgi:hypothetical protein
LNYDEVLAEYHGEDYGRRQDKRGWWDYLIIATAVGIFIWLGKNAEVPPVAMNFYWVAALAVVLATSMAVCCWVVWKRTKFS